MNPSKSSKHGVVKSTCVKSVKHEVKQRTVCQITPPRTPRENNSHLQQTKTFLVVDRFKSTKNYGTSNKKPK